MTSLFLNCHLLYIKRPRFHPHELPTTSPSPSLTPMAELPEVANGCDHELTKDGTVDLKGRPCFRSRGGRWKACSYIVGKPSSNFISSVRIFRILSYNNISIRTSITLCLIFFIGYEVFERMAFYGIGANLVLYLTTKLHENTVSSANNVTDWAGTVWMTPIIGAYIADAFLGRYWTFVFSSIIYLMVLIFFVLSFIIFSIESLP